MITYEDKEFGFTTQNVWFSDSFFDIEGYDRVIFNGIRQPLEIKGVERIDYATIIIDLKDGIDSVWANMSSKCRKAIRKSESCNFDIKINKDYEQFFAFYSSFAATKGVKPLVKSIDFMKKNGILFCAKKEGELIGGIFYLADESQMRGFVSCSKSVSYGEDDVSLATNVYKTPGTIEANRLLWWEAIKYAKAKEIDCLDMGGYYVGTNPNKELKDISEFKR